MDMGIGSGRSGALLAAAVSIGGAVGEVITKTETTFLNVPLSMLYVAIAGTMFGVFLLPGNEAARINADPGSTVQRRLAYMLFTAGFIGAVVLCYAFIAAWAVQVGFGVIRAITRFDREVVDSLVIPVTGLVGVGIRPWLPSLLKAVERRADRVIGGDQ